MAGQPEHGRKIMAEQRLVAHRLARPPRWPRPGRGRWRALMLPAAPVGDARVSAVDVRDIAAVAAPALTESGHVGAT